MKGVHRVFFVNCINVSLETYKIFKKIDGKLYNMPFHHVQWAMRVRGNPDNLCKIIFLIYMAH